MATAPDITLHVLGVLREYCGGVEQLPISAPTVRAALEDLERNQVALYRNVCDETGTVRRHLNVFVNADNVLVMPQNDSEQLENAVSTFFMRPLCTRSERKGVVGRSYPYTCMRSARRESTMISTTFLRWAVGTDRG